MTTLKVYRDHGISGDEGAGQAPAVRCALQAATRRERSARVLQPDGAAGNAEAIRLRREIAEQMSDTEIAQAQRAARAWLKAN